MGCEIEDLDRTEKAGPGIAYGCDELERLKSVLVHTPGEELSLVNESNYKYRGRNIKKRLEKRQKRKQKKIEKEAGKKK